MAQGALRSDTFSRDMGCQEAGCGAGGAWTVPRVSPSSWSLYLQPGSDSCPVSQSTAPFLSLLAPQDRPSAPTAASGLGEVTGRGQLGALSCPQGNQSFRGQLGADFPRPSAQLGHGSRGASAQTGSVLPEGNCQGAVPRPGWSWVGAGEGPCFLTLLFPLPEPESCLGLPSSLGGEVRECSLSSGHPARPQCSLPGPDSDKQGVRWQLEGVREEG